MRVYKGQEGDLIGFRLPHNPTNFEPLVAKLSHYAIHGSHEFTTMSFLHNIANYNVKVFYVIETKAVRGRGNL